MECVRETRQQRRARERSQGDKKSAINKETSTSPPKKQIVPLVISCLLGMVLALVGGKLFSAGDEPPIKQSPTIKPKASLRGKTYAHLLNISPEEVATLDIAEMNLLCGSGLNGTENIDVNTCLDRLDHLTEMVKAETERNWGRWQRNPGEYQNSEAHYRMGMLITVVRQDYKARYNPALITMPTAETMQDNGFFKNGADVFLQGLLSDEKMGTCASMPVLYVAIARRLEYPVYLVAAKGHLFCRWDDGKERMNFEGTGEGVRVEPDSHYQKWPFPISDQELESSTYLKSLNPQQELAVFLSSRADCLVTAKRNIEGLTAVSQAVRLVQDNSGLSGLMPQLAVRPMIPNIVFHMRQSATQREQSLKSDHSRYFPKVALPPDPNPNNNPTPFLPNAPRLPH